MPTSWPLQGELGQRGSGQSSASQCLPDLCPQGGFAGAPQRGQLCPHSPSWLPSKEYQLCLAFKITTMVIILGGGQKNPLGGTESGFADFENGNTSAIRSVGWDWDSPGLTSLGGFWLNWIGAASLGPPSHFSHHPLPPNAFVSKKNNNNNNSNNNNKPGV